MAKKSEHVETESKGKTRDALAEALAKELNKVSKIGKVAYFLTDEDDPSKVTDWVSTGSTELDLAISNRPHGGLPVGRICTLTGLEGCVTEDTKIEVIIE